VNVGQQSDHLPEVSNRVIALWFAPSVRKVKHESIERVSRRAGLALSRSFRTASTKLKITGDLTFESGYKQRGEAAVTANNVYREEMYDDIWEKEQQRQYIVSAKSNQ
jgi:hypothetical protein